MNRNARGRCGRLFSGGGGGVVKYAAATSSTVKHGITDKTDLTSVKRGQSTQLAL